MRTDASDGKHRVPTLIRQEIASARADLVETTHALQVALKQKLDWKQYLLARPLVVAGACFAFGMLLGYQRRR